MKLSKNLSLAEVTKSTTAKRLGIDNTPDDWTTENLRQIALNVFQPLRDAFGCPIYVSSGYRSDELNTAIGGSSRSQHVEGRALDLDADVYGGTTNSDIFRYILNCIEFDQLIWEFGDEDNPDWVHVSFVYDGVNRGRCLKACRDDKGKTYYEVIFPEK
ncbi:MAG: D-Ala-D-Ala carboxypeptidase family metallohydrolase [Opitutae bacterium]